MNDKVLVLTAKQVRTIGNSAVEYGAPGQIYLFMAGRSALRAVFLAITDAWQWL